MMKGLKPSSNMNREIPKNTKLSTLGNLICSRQLSVKLKPILENLSNIRRRGDVGGSAKKMGMRIRELERLYGIRNGSTSFQGNQHIEVVPNKSEAPSQEKLASQMGISVDTLQNYKMMADMIPELEELIDTGIVIDNIIVNSIQFYPTDV